MGVMAVMQGISSYQQAEATEDAVIQSYRTRNEQVEDAVVNANVERARAARRERARILAMAGEGGIGGKSVGIQLMDSRFQEGQDRNNNRTQALWQKQSALSSARNQAAGIPSTTAIAANTGLKVANASAQSYEPSTTTTNRSTINYQGQSRALTNNTAYVKNM